MAVIENTQSRTNTFGILKGVASAISGFFAATTLANSRAEKLAYYNQLSDEALAQHGLTREDIVHRVFPEMYFV